MNSIKRYFITGTDTDCGKTHVACRWLEDFREQGIRAQALKPVASGAVFHAGRWENEDVLRLQQYNCDQNIEICRWRYRLPIAPHIAAKEAGERLSAAGIAEFCDFARFQNFEHLLIEGAGGLMVPLNEEETWLDFLKLTQIPVLLVVGMRVGCINHALLTASILASNPIPVLGWVANQIDKDMLFFEENLRYLTEKLPMPLLQVLPFSNASFSG